MAEVIYPNGETLDFEHMKDGKVVFNKVVELVGYVEPRRLSDGRLMLMNKNAKFLNLEHNHVASELTWDQGLGPILGTVVVVTDEEMD